MFHSCGVLGIHVGSQLVCHAPLGVSGCCLQLCVPEFYNTDLSVKQAGIDACLETVPFFKNS